MLGGLGKEVRTRVPAADTRMCTYVYSVCVCVGGCPRARVVTLACGCRGLAGAALAPNVSVLCLYGVGAGATPGRLRFRTDDLRSTWPRTPPPEVLCRPLPSVRGEREREGEKER